MEKINCSTRCSLDGTRRPTLRRLLEDYGQLGFVCQEGQYSSEVSSEVRPVQTSEVRIRLRDSRVQKTDTADGQKIAGEGITKKNPGAGIQNREDKVSSLCSVTNNCSSAR
jgi:hypothetical protein